MTPRFLKKTFLGFISGKRLFLKKNYIYIKGAEKEFTTKDFFKKWSENADVENGCVNTVEEREDGMNWEIRFDINTLPCVK